ncbi:MAG TPA: YfiR family protein [Candidatus Methanoperedens sp.]|nr:YfiR family protein [Candidatus Methanoperedens sp.]
MTGRFVRRALLGCLVASFAVALPPAVCAAGDPTFGEYQVKAAFLKNFVKFVEWPPPAQSLTLCILGDDPFKEALAGSEEAGGGRKLTYRRIGAVREAADCQAVFVPAGQRQLLPDLLAAVAGRPVLTVGDGEGMAAAGLMLSFLIEDQKVRFDANLASARRAGLTISSRLLGLAKTVHNPR